jgi:hypothetical protein
VGDEYIFSLLPQIVHQERHERIEIPSKEAKKGVSQLMKEGEEKEGNQEVERTLTIRAAITS